MHRGGRPRPRGRAKLGCSAEEQTPSSHSSRIRYDGKFMPTYLITGVGGFIRSSLARAVLERGDQVRGLDNFSTGRRENLAEIQSRIDLREADLLDLNAVRE